MRFRNDGQMRKEIKDLIPSFGVQAIVLLAGVGMNVILARQLGPDQFGVYKLLISYTGLFQLLGVFGTEFALLHYLAASRESPQACISNGLATAQFTGLLSMAVGLAAAPLFLPYAFLYDRTLFLLSIPFHCCLLIAVTSFLGRDAIWKYGVAESLKPLLLVMGITIAVLTAPLDLRIVSQVYLGVMMAAAAIVMIGLWQSGFLRQTLRELQWSRIRTFLAFGRYPYLAVVLSYCVYRADIFIVAYLLGEREAGLYGVTVVCADLLKNFGKAIQLVLLPKIPGYDPLQRRIGLVLVCKVLVGVLMAVAVVFWLIGKPLIIAVFNESFGQSFLLVAWLLPGLVVYGLVQVLAAYFISLGHVKINALISGIALGVNISLDLLLIPSYGLVAAAIASSISYGIAAGVMVFYFMRYSGATLSEFLPRWRDLQRCRNLLRQPAPATAKSIYPGSGGTDA